MPKSRNTARKVVVLKEWIEFMKKRTKYNHWTKRKKLDESQ